jgi:hypothetical protein
MVAGADADIQADACFWCSCSCRSWLAAAAVIAAGNPKAATVISAHKAKFFPRFTSGLSLHRFLFVFLVASTKQSVYDSCRDINEGIWCSC